MTDSEWSAVVDNERQSVWLLVEMMDVLGMRTHDEVFAWLEDRLEMRIEHTEQELERYRQARREAHEVSAS